MSINSALLRRVALATVMAAIVATPDVSAAQARSRSTGITFGGGLAGAALSTDFEGTTTTESGSGFNLELGWGFTKNWSAFVGINSATIESDIEYGLAQVDLGARYTFRQPTHQVRPYLDAALAGRAFNVTITDGFDTAEVEATSSGITLGGGLQIFFTQAVALDVGLNYSFGSFSDWEANGIRVPIESVDATSTNFRLGLRFWPSSR
jgi:opacity protein-like surface antigen